jgi:hypothetical protein
MPSSLRAFWLGIFSFCAVVGAVPTDPFLAVPGTVLAQSDHETTYLGSPSIAILPDGTYVASHDTYGASQVVCVYRSTDQGVSWVKSAEFPGEWTNLFVHGGHLYAMGTSGVNGSLVVRRSTNGGQTWTTPSNGDNGLLRSGSFHTSALPVAVHQGRIWRAFEDLGGGGAWPHCFRAFLMSAPVDADLLKASSWTLTPAMQSASTWLGSKFDGWLEGNVVVSPEGRLLNMLRANTKAGIPEKVAIIDFGTGGVAGSFDPEGRPAENPLDESGFIDFPGGAKKFSIRRDPLSGNYWALTNPSLPPWAGTDPVYVRNTVSLVHSTDLVHWEVRCHLIFHPDTSKHGCQYLDWQIDGDDLVAVARTSWGGTSYHDAKFLTFHRIANFRTLTMADSVSTDGGISWPFPGIQASGSGFVPSLLENGTVALSNRNYVWEEVPPEFANSLITRVAGGIPATLKLQATDSTRAYIAANIAPPGAALPGWTSTGQSFVFNDGFRTRLWLYQRDFSPGQVVQVPQLTWSGTLLVMPPAAGPVGWWRCESIYHGTATADELYSFHGKPSLPSPTASGPGPSGTALRFQPGQHVDLGNVFPLTRVPFTIAFWIKQEGGITTYGVPFSKMATGSLDGYLFEINPPGLFGKMRFVASSESTQLTSTTRLIDGNWHHVALTSEPGGDAILYLDGEEEMRCPAPVIRPTAAALRFGARTNSGGPAPGFDGWLDEIQIYHKSLSATEIATMATHPGDPPPGAALPQTNVRLTLFPTYALLTWNAIPGRSYAIYRSTTLEEGSWFLHEVVTSQDATGEYQEYSPSGRAFFRVELLP